MLRAVAVKRVRELEEIDSGRYLERARREAVDLPGQARHLEDVQESSPRALGLVAVVRIAGIDVGRPDRDELLFDARLVVDVGLAVAVVRLVSVLESPLEIPQEGLELDFGGFERRRREAAIKPLVAAVDRSHEAPDSSIELR